MLKDSSLMIIYYYPRYLHHEPSVSFYNTLRETSMYYGDISYSLQCKELIVSVLDRRRLQKRRTSTTCLPRKDGSWQSTQLIGTIMILSLSTAVAYNLKFYDCTKKTVTRSTVTRSSQPVRNNRLRMLVPTTMIYSKK